jgi:hypothetical protein
VFRLKQNVSIKISGTNYCWCFCHKLITSQNELYVKAFTVVMFQCEVFWVMTVCSVVVGYKCPRMKMEAVDLWNTGILPQHHVASQLRRPGAWCESFFILHCAMCERIENEVNYWSLFDNLILTVSAVPVCNLHSISWMITEVKAKVVESGEWDSHVPCNVSQ